MIEIYRQPAPAGDAPFGWSYQSTLRLGRGGTISPLAAPDVVIAVGDLLPPA